MHGGLHSIGNIFEDHSEEEKSSEHKSKRNQDEEEPSFSSQSSIHPIDIGEV